MDITAEGSYDHFYFVLFRWPTLLPILDPQYVAKKIINAVLTNQVYLLLPRSMYFITALKKLVHYFFYFNTLITKNFLNYINLSRKDGLTSVS